MRLGSWVHGVGPGEAWEVLADWAGQVGSGEQASPSPVDTALSCNSQGVRLDRVRGGRQKYKRRPEVDPLPFPGPFPAGPLAVAGGPRKTGENAVGSLGLWGQGGQCLSDVIHTGL